MTNPVSAKTQLQDAFELFNQLSERLSGSYQTLQQQVVSLDQKLAASHSERLTLLAEINALKLEVSRTQRLSTMGQMTARLAHQIRTPLSTALLYASQLKQKSLKTEQHDCFVDRLLVGLHHLDHMVNDMLVFARGGACGEDAVSVRELLEQVRQALMPQLQEHQARWIITSENEDILIRGQREVLASVLMNLATNALNACKKQAHLQWSYVAGNGYVELAVQDNGPGIQEQIADQIFEPFFTTRSNGTGLGLAVVRAVIDAHGGSIELDAGFQSGARFVLRLPLFEAHLQLPSEMLPSKKQAKATANSRCA